MSLNVVIVQDGVAIMQCGAVTDGSGHVVADLATIAPNATAGAAARRLAFPIVAAGVMGIRPGALTAIVGALAGLVPTVVLESGLLPLDRNREGM